MGKLQIKEGKKQGKESRTERVLVGEKEKKTIDENRVKNGERVG